MKNRIITVLAAILLLSGLLNSSIVSAEKGTDDKNQFIKARIEMIYGNSLSKDEYKEVFNCQQALWNDSRFYWECPKEIEQILIKDEEQRSDEERLSIDRYIAEKIELIFDEGGGAKGPVDPNPGLTMRTNAIQYAATYWQTPNMSFPDWTSYGGDCANFVSQCLYAGGRTMIGTASTQAVADNIYNWFSYGSTNSTVNVSESWRGAHGFFLHWRTHAVSSHEFSLAQMAPYGDAYTYASPGDAVSLFKNPSKTAYHTMIVVGRTSSGDLVLAAHTGNTYSALLSSKASGITTGCIVYNVFGY